MGTMTTKSLYGGATGTAPKPTIAPPTPGPTPNPAPVPTPPGPPPPQFNKSSTPPNPPAPTAAGQPVAVTASEAHGILTNLKNMFNNSASKIHADFDKVLAFIEKHIPEGMRRM